MEEMLDIYTRDGKYLGIKTRIDCHKPNPGYYHKPVWIWIVNDKKEILIQKRASVKSSFPNYWDAPSAGHLDAGETPIEGAIRETKEELGIETEANDYKFVGEYISEVTWELGQVYVLKLNVSIDDIILQEDEVDEVKWLSFDEFKKVIHSDEFIPYDEEYKMMVLNLLQDYIDYLTFEKALKNNDKELLKTINKVDIHNHAVSSCTKNYLIDNGINLCEDKINNIESLINFSRTYLTPLQLNKKGLKLLLEGNFQNCIETGVTVVGTSIDYKDCIRTFNSDVSEFVKFLESFKYDNLTILWDLGISRDSYKEEYKTIILQLLNTKFFSGLDLASTENSIPNSEFVDFYNLANQLGMITKVHTGEQLGADYIKECIIDFNPKQIQHGIHIVEDENVMQLAKEKGIVFNVCPTSNVVLGYAKSIKEHPIKTMIEYGLNVTLATDDLLFFDSDINDEYLKLHNENVLTIEQLNAIRKYGLSITNNL